MSQPKIYIISGLGASVKAFTSIDFSGYQPIFIDWIEPKTNESLANYAYRLSKEITDEKYALMGLSFGGMLAIEIAKLKQPTHLYLISTACISAELPRIIGVIKSFNVLNWVPKYLFVQSNSVVEFLFGVTTTAEKALLKEFLANTTPDFVIWALGAIARWQNAEKPLNAIRFHGLKDRLIPFPSGEDCLALPGGHLALLQTGQLISRRIKPL